MVIDEGGRLRPIPKIEDGLVFIPEDAPWLHAFLRELLAFPNSRYNDQIDSLSQALELLGWWSRRRRTRPNPERPDDTRGPANPARKSVGQGTGAAVISPPAAPITGEASYDPRVDDSGALSPFTSS